MRCSALALLPLVALLSSCPEPSDPLVPRATATGRSSSEAIEASRIGAPCSEGQCGSATCLPLPGGYCTTWCPGGGACGDDATCVPTVRGGEMCLDACESNEDCRGDQGYECHPQFRACMLPGFVGPRAPVCKGEPPRPRARFAAPALLSTIRRSKYSFEPTATLLDSGDLVVAYTAMNGIQEPNDLDTVVVHPDGTFGEPHQLGSSKLRHFDPWLTTFAGEAVLVWLGHDGGQPDKNPTIAMSRSKDGENWSTPLAVIDETDCPAETRGCADKPMVIATRAPKKPKGFAKPKAEPPSLALLYYSEVTEGLRTRATADAVTFSASAPAAGGAYGDVFADSRGGLHLAVQTFAAGDGRPDRFGDARGAVEYASSADGGKTWSTPLVVSAAGDPVPFYFSNPQVVFDAERNRLHVLYPTGTPDGRWDIVLRSSTDKGKTWTRTKVNDDASCANHMKPTVALDPKTGELHVIWAENRGGVGRMVYSSCSGGTGGEAKCGANEALSEPFASYGFVRHSLAWLGEYDVLLLDEERRVLHAVFTMPVLEKGVAVSRIFHASAKL